MSINPNQQISKNAQIKETLKETKLRRSLKRCRTINVKIQKNKLNKSQELHLKMLFIEAKWIYNHLLDDIKLRANDTYVKSLKKVPVKLQEKTEDRELKFISSQMKQGVATQIKSNLSALAILKRKGLPVGRLKFKSFLNSINLKQHNNTYKIDFNKGKISIQGLRKPLKVNGLDQIRKMARKYSDIEIANAKLLQINKDYYINITLYHTDEEKINDTIGIDMGVKEQITLSNGLGFSYNIPESKRLKKLQKVLAKKKGSKKNQRKSKNFYKQLDKVKKEYRNISSKRRNINNHIFHVINLYKNIAMQDEMIKSWHQHKLFGKKIQYTGLGAIKSKIKSLESQRTDILSKSLPTTKSCSSCGTSQKMNLSDRVYKCECCGMILNRDINSTYNMIGFSKFSGEHRKTMPLERESAVVMKLQLVDGLNIRLHSMKEEARSFNYE